MRIIQSIILILLFFQINLCVFADESPVIAVAANFIDTANQLGNSYTRLTGNSLRFTSGASGSLVHQIINGAPFEMFLSADENYVVHLYKQGLTPDSGKIYAIGVLVLYIPYSTHLDSMRNINSILLQAISGPKYKIAFANPEIAPYGQAARQVIRRLTDTKNQKSQEILGENVGQTAQFALSGSVDAAFLPLSLALTDTMQESGHFETIPEDWYPALKQRVVLMNNAGMIARDFYRFLDTKDAHAIIVKSGYSLPGNNN